MKINIEILFSLSITKYSQIKNTHLYSSIIKFYD